MRFRPRYLMALIGLFTTIYVLIAMEMPGRLGYVVALHEPSPEIRAGIDARGLFRKHCAGCHAVDAGDIRAAAARGDVPILADSLAPRSVLAMRIAYGSGTQMPEWESQLTRDEIWALADFVDGLRN